MSNELKSVDDPAVRAAFDACPADLRAELLQLRELIFETAGEIRDVDGLVETTKWGQPAYLPSKPRTGSTIRIGMVKDNPDRYAMFFHCQTTLIENFRAQYPDEFVFQGNRAIEFTKGKPLAVDALKHCIAQALTYHLKPGHTGTEKSTQL